MKDMDRFIAMIATEVHKAENKYPIFCNRLPRIGNTLELTQFALATARARSDAEKHGGYSFENTINEEILEVLEAWQLEDYDACMTELAQCGAVILRAMDFVNKYKGDKHGNNG